MDGNNELFDELSEIIEEDPRYSFEAYIFVLEALEYTTTHYVCKHSKVHVPSGPQHVSGRELLGGIREFAHQKFGFLAREVFREWGVTRTADFGEIVFNMVDKQMMGKTPQDSRADFDNIYDFHEAFDNYNVKLDSSQK